MKLSELAEKSAELLKKYGDSHVSICIETEIAGERQQVDVCLGELVASVRDTKSSYKMSTVRYYLLNEGFDDE